MSYYNRAQVDPQAHSANLILKRLGQYYSSAGQFCLIFKMVGYSLNWGVPKSHPSANQSEERICEVNCYRG